MFVAIQSVKVPPRSIAISIPAFGGTGGGVIAEGILMMTILSPHKIVGKRCLEVEDSVKKDMVLKVDEI